MNANAWAALGMSPIQADPRIKNLPLQSVSHRIRASCLCQTCIHSSVVFLGFITERKVCDILQIPLPEIHVQHCNGAEAAGDPWSF